MLVPAGVDAVGLAVYVASLHAFGPVVVPDGAVGQLAVFVLEDPVALPVGMPAFPRADAYAVFDLPDHASGVFYRAGIRRITAFLVVQPLALFEQEP